MGVELRAKRDIYSEIWLSVPFRVSGTTQQSTSSKHLASNLAATDTSQGEEFPVEGMLKYPPIHASMVDKNCNNCPCCRLAVEDALHALVSCPITAAVWRASLQVTISR